MKAKNRFCWLNSERQSLVTTPELHLEQGFDSVHLYKVKLKRFD